MSIDDEIPIIQNFRQNIKGLLIAIAILIIFIYILPKFMLFLFKIYDKLPRKSNIIKVYGANSDDFSGSKIINKTTVIKDETGNIVNESSNSEVTGDGIFKNITEQVLNSDFIDEDGIVLDDFGNKIADFGSKENLEAFKRNISGANQVNKQIVNDGYVKTFSGQMPKEIADKMKKLGSVRMIKDQYGNVSVIDECGNILEEEEKKQAMELLEELRTYRGSAVKNEKMNKDDIIKVIEKNNM